MTNGRLPADLENILDHEPESDVHKQTVDSLIENLMGTAEFYDLALKTKKELLSDILVYMVKSHGKHKRKQGVLFSQHPYEAALAVSKETKDLVAIAGALLHDTVEEQVKHDIDRYLSENHKYISRYRPLRKYMARRLDSQVRQKIFTAARKDLYENLLGIFDRVERDKRTQYIPKMRDIYKLVRALTRTGPYYYDDISGIFRGDTSYENKIRGTMAKFKDSGNNVRTLNPLSKDEKVLIKPLIKKLLGMTSYLGMTNEKVEAWIEKNETPGSDLESTYNQTKPYLFFSKHPLKFFTRMSIRLHYDLSKNRYMNKFYHLLRDHGPYLNSDKIYVVSKCTHVLNQARDFINDIKNITYQRQLKVLLGHYASNHNNFPFNEQSTIDTEFDLLEIILELNRNHKLKTDMETLGEYMEAHRIFPADSDKVEDAIALLHKTDSAKSDPKEMTLHNLVNYHSQIYSKYQFRDDESIKGMKRIIWLWKKYKLEKSTTALQNQALHAVNMCIGHSKKYHIPPRKVIGERATVAAYEDWDRVTSKDAGHPYDGMIQARFDKRIKGSKSPRYRDFFYRIRNLQAALALREVLTRFNSYDDFVVRGWDSRGLSPEVSGIQTESSLYQDGKVRNTG